MTKPARTAVPVHPLLTERWSPRAFDPAFTLSPATVTALLEAARWAPSASNSQPWRFAVGLRGDAAFATLFDALAPGNQAWAGQAAALVLVAGQTEDETGTPRPWAAYDSGQAAAHLSVQAQAEGLAVHQLGGFDRAAVAAAFRLPGSVVPLVVLAVGRHSGEVELPEPFASRERAPRTRLPLPELLLAHPADAALPLSA